MIYQGYTYETRITKEQAQAQEAIEAVEKYNARTMKSHSEYMIIKMALMMDDGNFDDVIQYWAAFCNQHQLCLHCGGDLVLETWGNVIYSGGEVWDNTHDEMICRECGRASDWKQPEIETGELPI